MLRRDEVVITGVGVVSPIGIGKDAFWSSLVAGASGIREISTFDSSGLPVHIAGEVRDFDPKQFVTPRKSLKVMARDSVLAVAAARLAVEDAGVRPGVVDPDRLGVVLGADRLRNELDEIHESYAMARDATGRFKIGLWATEGSARFFPLGFLKVLPNMLASHISIIHDARGPNNTLHQAEVSSLAAIAEATRVIQRGAADCMLTGAASSRMHPLDWVRGCMSEVFSAHQGDPALAPRPFDADRDGQVRGEGSAVFVLERRAHAEARGAKILGRIVGVGSACVVRPDRRGDSGAALERAVRRALDEAHYQPHDIGHINAHGLSTVPDDVTEAQTLSRLLPDVPVTALKSYFGNLSAAGGAVEMAGSVLALADGCVPATRNCEQLDQRCPIHVVRQQPLMGVRRTALLVNQTAIGQSAAIVVAGAED